MQRDLVTDLVVVHASLCARGGSGAGRCVDGIPSHVHAVRLHREGSPAGSQELPPPSTTSRFDVVLHHFVPEG